MGIFITATVRSGAARSAGGWAAAACDHLIDAPVLFGPGSGPEPRPTLLDLEPDRVQVLSDEGSPTGVTPRRQRTIRMASQFAGEQSRRLSSWLTRWLRGDDRGDAPPDCVESLVERAAEASSTRAIEAIAYRRMGADGGPRSCLLTGAARSRLTRSLSGG